ncbi:MAG TPA: SMR family transporter [Chitinophagales bacterium]|nr:SMR family transporter [Chitinophagales bacterium]
MLTNSWLWLAILFNVFTNAGFKYAAMADGNPKKKWTIFSVSLIFGFLNSICFTEALKGVSLNIAGAVFFSLTIVSLTLVSYYLFNEQISPLHLAGVLVIVAGVIMVNL